MVMMFVGGVVLMFDTEFLYYSYRTISTGWEFFIPTQTLVGVKLLSDFAHDSICALLAHYAPKPSCRAQLGRKPELLRPTCALGFSRWN